ncbi:hypothetical protein [uncultured Cohaesibacter sp.]|uniref:hypothetical protein n=1 Tax=uncultured Cohaesibacter sp. TaxID=1002546 RepID=UPI00292ECF61|nr:hypothetical protein [uncultured Cohaesibacter sp.]
MTNSSISYALLVFDAYYRGSNPKLNELDAVVTEIAIDLPQGFQEANFEATVYDTGNEIVISYRETDEVLTDDSGADAFFNGDIWNGWGVGKGSVRGQQATMAIQLYQTIKNDPAYAGKEIVLTGHSLGGGWQD